MSKDKQSKKSEVTPNLPKTQGKFSLEKLRDQYRQELRLRLEQNYPDEPVDEKYLEAQVDLAINF